MILCPVTGQLRFLFFPDLNARNWIELKLDGSVFSNLESRRSIRGEDGENIGSVVGSLLVKSRAICNAIHNVETNNHIWRELRSREFLESFMIGEVFHWNRQGYGSREWYGITEESITKPGIYKGDIHCVLTELVPFCPRSTGLTTKQGLLFDVNGDCRGRTHVLQGDEERDISISSIERQGPDDIYFCLNPWALRQFHFSDLGFGGFFHGIGTLFQWAELDSVDYRLGKRCNGKPECKEYQRGIGISSVADKNYKFLDFSEQVSDASSELSEFNWKWFPVGVLGFACFLSGIGVYFFATRESVAFGIILTVVGWVCGQVGFIRWFN